METTLLATTGRRTTRLGFGCSGIGGGLERRRSLALLEAAYDAGIRHFDVAPMYGHGTAEETLGQFLQGRPDATVTTKFGVLPLLQSPLKAAMRAVAKRLAPAALRGRRSASSGTTQAAMPKEKFTRERASHSLERSLRLLRRAQIDLFLLHECTAAELTDPMLLEALHTWTEQRRIGAFGVGSTMAALPTLLSDKPAYCSVVQSEWSAFQPALVPDGRFHMTHRALQCPWQDTLRRLLTSPETLACLCEETGCDLADARVWPRLLLRAALLRNAGTVVLFSSRDERRIRANCEIAFDQTLDCAATRLHAFLLSFVARGRTRDAHAAERQCCL